MTRPICKTCWTGEIAVFGALEWEPDGHGDGVFVFTGEAEPEAYCYHCDDRRRWHFDSDVLGDDLAAAVEMQQEAARQRELLASALRSMGDPTCINHDTWRREALRYQRNAARCDADARLLRDGKE